MRVLWLTKGLGPGGAEHLLLAVARAADPARVVYEAAYLLPWKQQLVPDLEAAGVRTHLLDGARELDLRWAGRLRALLRRQEFDVLHSHSPYPAAIARLVVRSLPRARRPRLVYTEHNVWSSYRAATRALGRATYRYDDARLTVATAVRTSMPRSLGASSEVLIHGVEVEGVRAALASRDQTRSGLGVASDELLVATLANLRSGKDYPNLLHAAKTVLARVPKARWVAAGQGPLADEIAALADAPGLERLQLLGHRADPWNVLAAADLLVVGSRVEGLPVVVMEALAAGVPIVATAVGGVPELVTDGVEGRLVPPARPDLLADAVISLLEDEPERSRMAQAGTQRAASVDVARAARRLEALYESLIETGA